MGNLIFNGVSTKDLGVVIQTPPVYEFPTKDYEVIHVEGKNGDIIIDKNSYQNTKRSYYIAIEFRKNSSFVDNVNKLINWLTSSTGYSKLEDSYEPNHYRMALFRNNGEFTNLYNQATAIQISFECKPQRYLNTGDEPIIINELGTFIRISNPTNCIALPEITMDGTGLIIDFYSGKDYNNPINTSNLINLYEEQCIIDSELQECYTNEKYVNEFIMLTNGFPKLYPGDNWIKITTSSEEGTLRSFSIKPKWWTL